jgi:hypothetical protein
MGTEWTPGDPEWAPLGPERASPDLVPHPGTSMAPLCLQWVSSGDGMGAGSDLALEVASK